MHGKLLFSFIASLLVSAYAFGQWQFLPAGQPFVYSIVVDSTGQRILLSTDASGLWRSMNGGNTWEPFSAHIRPQGGVGVLSQYALDPTCDTVLCMGSAPNEYWNGYTFDGGLTWERFDDDRIQQYGHFQVWNHGHNVWFFADSHGTFYRSLDFGQTWTALFDQGDIVTGVHQDRNADSVLYLTTIYWHSDFILEYGLMRSNDLGQTWMPMLNENSLPDSNVLIFYGLLRLSNNDLIATGWFADPYGPLISADNGATWHRADEFPNEVLAAPEPDNVIVEDTQYPGRLFMAAGDVAGGILRSDDYGHHWVTCGGGLPSAVTFAHAIVQNPARGNLYADVAYHGVFSSTDHGDTWQPIPLPEVGTSYGEFHAFEQAVFLNQSGENSPYLQWELESPFTQWRALEVGEGWQDSSLWFGPVLEKHGDSLLACASIWNPTDTIHSVMARSIDNGNHWVFGAALPYDVEESTVNARTSDSGTRMLAITQDYNSLVRSDDHGETWSLIYTAPGGGWIDGVAQSDSMIALFFDALDNGLTTYWVAVTTNGGASWTTAPPVPSTFSGLTLVGDNVYGFYGNSCVHLQDSTWDVRGSAPGYDFIIALTAEDTIFLLAGTDPGVLQISRDFGFTWQTRNYELPFNGQSTWLGGLSYDPYRHRLWAMAGVGACYLDQSQLSASGPLQFLPADYTLLSVYPNPFNSETKIRFDLLKPEPVNVVVYDLLGRVVKTVVDELRNAGRNEVALAMPDAASGIYFVRLNAGAMQKTVKIALIK